MAKTEGPKKMEPRYKTHARIKDWEKLEQNWDSYGSYPPDPRSIQLASRLLRMFTKRPHVAPNNGSGFCLTFMGDGLELEVEFTPDTDGKRWQAAFYLVDEDIREDRTTNEAFEEAELVDMQSTMMEQ